MITINNLKYLIFLEDEIDVDRERKETSDYFAKFKQNITANNNTNRLTYANNNSNAKLPSIHSRPTGLRLDLLEDNIVEP